MTARDLTREVGVVIVDNALSEFFELASVSSAHCSREGHSNLLKFSLRMMIGVLKYSIKFSRDKVK